MDSSATRQRMAWGTLNARVRPAPADPRARGLPQRPEAPPASPRAPPDLGQREVHGPLRRTTATSHPTVVTRASGRLQCATFLEQPPNELGGEARGGGAGPGASLREKGASSAASLTPVPAALRAFCAHGSRPAQPGRGDQRGAGGGTIRSQGHLAGLPHGFRAQITAPGPRTRAGAPNRSKPPRPPQQPASFQPRTRTEPRPRRTGRRGNRGRGGRARRLGRGEPGAAAAHSTAPLVTPTSGEWLFRGWGETV